MKTYAKIFVKKFFVGEYTVCNWNHVYEVYDNQVQEFNAKGLEHQVQTKFFKFQ